MSRQAAFSVAKLPRKYLKPPRKLGTLAEFKAAIKSWTFETPKYQIYAPNDPLINYANQRDTDTSNTPPKLRPDRRGRSRVCVPTRRSFIQ